MNTRVGFTLNPKPPYMLNTRSAKKNQILLIFSLFREYSNLVYVRFHVLYRVDQAEYVICILVAAPQEYVNM